MPNKRSCFLAALSIVAGIKAADCLFAVNEPGDKEPVNDDQFMSELVSFVRDSTSPNMRENTEVILRMCRPEVPTLKPGTDQLCPPHVEEARGDEYER